MITNLTLRSVKRAFYILNCKICNLFTRVEALEEGGGGGGIQSIVQGDGILIDNSDPLNPQISSIGLQEAKDLDYIITDFDGNSLPSDFINSNSSYSVTGGNLSFTGAGSGLYNQLVRSTKGVLTEQNTIEGVYSLLVSPNSTSGGVSFGLESYNSNNYKEGFAAGLVTKSTDPNFGKPFIYSKFSGVTLYGDVANTNINVNDIIKVKIIRNQLNYSVIITNTTQLWQIRLDTTLVNNANPFVINNSSYPAIYHLGNSVIVTSFKYTVNIPSNVDLMIIGNSIVAGQGSSSPYTRQVFLIGNPENNIFSGGGADISDEVVKRLGEIIAIKPKRVVLHDIAGNDILFAVPDSTWKSNLSLIDTTLINNNIIPIWTNGQPRTTNNMSAQKIYIESVIRDKGRLVIDTWNALLGTGTALNINYNSGDGTHPNDKGHLVTANTINNALGFEQELDPWLKGGNNISSSDFIGSENNTDVIIKANNVEGLRVKSGGGAVEIAGTIKMAGLLSMGTAGKIHLFDIGSPTGNYGFGIGNTNPYLQSFTPTATAGWTWNGGGTVQTVGINEYMRLTATGLSVGSTTVTDKFNVAGNINLLTAGNKIKIKTGTNASIGTSTLVAGTVTVATTAALTASLIFVTVKTPGGTQGFLSVPTIVNGTSFTINSSSVTDTSTVNWWIIN